MSLNEITTDAAWIAGLAIVSLIAAGWRKTARATADPARALRPRRAPIGVPLEEVRAPLYRPAPIRRRVWSILAGSTMALVTGAVVATIIGVGMAYFVITLSTMLKR